MGGLPPFGLIFLLLTRPLIRWSNRLRVRRILRRYTGERDSGAAHVHVSLGKVDFNGVFPEAPVDFLVERAARGD